MNRPNAYIGSAVDRIEDERLLTGKGTYVGDLNLEHLLHAAILRSPVSHGLIRSIDVSAARALAGDARLHRREILIIVFRHGIS